MNRRAGALAVACMLMVCRNAAAQDAGPGAAGLPGTPGMPGVMDAIDIWNRIRHKAPAAADANWDYHEPMKAWAPVIGAKPSSGLQIGIAGNVAFFLSEPTTTHISSVVASATISAKQQTALSGRFTVFTAADVWRIDGDNRAQWTSQDTYGLGTAAASTAAINAKFDFFRIHETLYRRVSPGVFVGLGLHFDDHSNIRAGIDTEPEEWDGGGFVEYSQAHGLPLESQISAGPSINLLVDTRDSAIDPRTGWFGAASYRGLIRGFLGGTTGWQWFRADGRAYASLTNDGRQRLALWTYGEFAFAGTVPYFDLPATGMDVYGRSARGYAEGRFRGERLLYGEVEYRATLTANGLLGMVAFLNATTVSNLESGEHLFDSAAPGAGAGLRLLLNKRSRTNLCFDLGFGKQGSHGVYLAVQETF